MKEEAKMVYLLECLQKTPPPVSALPCYYERPSKKQNKKNLPPSNFFFFEQVLIFAEKKADVDAIHEYLLLKGVEAVAIHGGKGTRLQAALPRTLPLSFLSGEFC